MFVDYFDRRLRQLSQGMYKKVTYIRMRKFMTQKRKSLFIPMKVQLITNRSVIPYISEINSTSSSLKKQTKKKEPQEREREKGKEEERLKKKEKENKEEKEKEEEKIEKAIQKVYRHLQTHSLARS